MVLNCFLSMFQDPAGIFELIEVVGNGTYGQVYKVSSLFKLYLLYLKKTIAYLFSLIHIFFFFFNLHSLHIRSE